MTHCALCLHMYLSFVPLEPCSQLTPLKHSKKGIVNDNSTIAWQNRYSSLSLDGRPNLGGKREVHIEDIFVLIVKWEVVGWASLFFTSYVE